MSHLSNVSYLIGYPIKHSASPDMHDAISKKLSFPYAQVLVESMDLTSFITYLRSHTQYPRLLGSGITMPHKVAVIPMLDELTPEGKAIGAVNTVFFREHESSEGTRLIGTNTDCIGIRDAFLNNYPKVVSCKGLPGLVIGGGGTCRAAIYALQTFLGCSRIYIINRDPSEVEAVISECKARKAAHDLVHVSTLEQAENLEPPRLIVSAVPDFEPVTEGEKVARKLLEHLLQKPNDQGSGPGALLEMCYHPSPHTRIASLATGCRWQVIGGIEAMIGQGLEQARLWTGQDISQDVRADARQAVAKR